MKEDDPTQVLWEGRRTVAPAQRGAKRWAAFGGAVVVRIGGSTSVIMRLRLRDRMDSLASCMQLRSTMPGKLVRHLIADGSVVKQNQAYCEVEVMKMYVSLTSSIEGKISFVKPEGSFVVPGDVVAVIEPTDPSVKLSKTVLSRDEIPTKSNQLIINSKQNEILERAFEQVCSPACDVTRLASEPWNLQLSTVVSSGYLITEADAKQVPFAWLYDAWQLFGRDASRVEASFRPTAAASEAVVAFHAAGGRHVLRGIGGSSCALPAMCGDRVTASPSLGSHRSRTCFRSILRYVMGSQDTHLISPTTFSFV
jgi:biotin carboxyl carrier protein